MSLYEYTPNNLIGVKRLHWAREITDFASLTYSRELHPYSPSIGTLWEESGFLKMECRGTLRRGCREVSTECECGIYACLDIDDGWINRCNMIDPKSMVIIEAGGLTIVGDKGIFKCSMAQVIGVVKEVTYRECKYFPEEGKSRSIDVEYIDDYASEYFDVPLLSEDETMNLINTQLKFLKTNRSEIVAFSTYRFR